MFYPLLDALFLEQELGVLEPGPIENVAGADSAVEWQRTACATVAYIALHLEQLFGEWIGLKEDGRLGSAMFCIHRSSGFKVLLPARLSSLEGE